MTPIAIILVLLGVIALLIDRIPVEVRHYIAIALFAGAAIVVAVHGRVLA